MHQTARARDAVVRLAEALVHNTDAVESSDQEIDEEYRRLLELHGGPVCPCPHEH